ncbi:MAG: hypothetical protein H6712_12140 [Myxococcales bacterium]|nr:hypothetical protein [Myxococcales bacterium]MCB9714606.1 hypothetical protein [Myxococcales bacterium]
MIALPVLVLLLAPAPEPRSLDSPEAVPQREQAATSETSSPPGSLAPEQPPEIEPEPTQEALAHLDRAFDLEVAGDLESAEAESSVAIALAPDDPAAYLARAQIRMKLSEAPTHEGNEPSARRARAALLRLAAEDVTAYLERSGLPPEDRVFLETRRDALLRDADALEPPAEPVAPLPPTEPIEPIEPRSAPSRRHATARDGDPRRRTSTLVGSGAALSTAAVGLFAASLQIRQTCRADGLCAVEWHARPSRLVPGIVLSAMGSSSLVLGLMDAPALARPRPRRIVGITTVTLGSLATVVGTVTAALVGSRWAAPVSPSDDGALRSTQALGNASAASFSAALPLLGAGLSAWIGGRRRADHERRLGHAWHR